MNSNELVIRVDAGGHPGLSRVTFGRLGQPFVTPVHMERSNGYGVGKREDV